MFNPNLKPGRIVPTRGYSIEYKSKKRRDIIELH